MKLKSKTVIFTSVFWSDTTMNSASQGSVTRACVLRRRFQPRCWLSVKSAQLLFHQMPVQPSLCCVIDSSADNAARSSAAASLRGELGFYNRMTGTDRMFSHCR